jgi:2'-hydroxyisoflavone reductase
MRILILGGTIFLGRALVEAALERGHAVTLFNRGRSNPGLFPNVEELHGDRTVNLSAIEGCCWDAAIDTSGYLPRVVDLKNFGSAYAEYMKKTSMFVPFLF